jgi:hypothetical protein
MLKVLPQVVDWDFLGLNKGRGWILEAHLFNKFFAIHARDFCPKNPMSFDHNKVLIILIK